jgi:hypothetical protein
MTQYASRGRSRSMSTAEHGERRLAPLFDWRSAVCDSSLSSTQRHVLLTLSLYMNTRGGSAHPGSARLAHDTALHVDTVKRALRSATDAGWLIIREKGSALPGKPRRATEYVCNVPDSYWGQTTTSQEMTEGPQWTTGGPESDDWGAQDLPISSMNSSITRERKVEVVKDPPAPPPWVTEGMTLAEWMAADREAKRKASA